MRIIIEIDQDRCEINTNGENLSDALDLFERALKGVGFVFDGNVQIIDNHE